MKAIRKAMLATFLVAGAGAGMAAANNPMVGGAAM